MEKNVIEANADHDWVKVIAKDEMSSLLSTAGEHTWPKITSQNILEMLILLKSYIKKLIEIELVKQTIIPYIRGDFASSGKRKIGLFCP